VSWETNCRCTSRHLLKDVLYLDESLLKSKPSRRLQFFSGSLACSKAASYHQDDKLPQPLGATANYDVTGTKLVLCGLLKRHSRLNMMLSESMLSCLVIIWVRKLNDDKVSTSISS
jgi:hypothetical protein